jgi:cold shock CspA family protein
MQGTMLWFNNEKGYGFINTEHGERLYVAESGFLPGNVPEGRCAGRSVTFERIAVEGDTRAIGAFFPPEAAPRRARRRRSG